MRLTIRRLFCPAMLVLAGGCVGPAATREVNEAQQRTIGALAGACAADLAMLRELLTANLDARRVLLLGGAHREMLARGYLTPALEADPDRFHKDLTDASAHSILIGEVRTGRMTEAGAIAYLNDYALTLRMSDADAAREAMLGTLAPIMAHDRAASALVAALDAHTLEIAGLFEDALANAHSLAAFASFDPDAGGVSRQVIREIWLRTVLDDLDDPAERDAAARLLDRVLNPASETDHG